MARDSILDSVTAEIVGKKAETRKSGKLKATHDYEEFRSVATPRLIAEMGGDLDFAVRELYSLRSVVESKMPSSVRTMGWIAWGVIMFTAGYVWRAWWIS